MAKSKVKMSKDQMIQCNAIIHTATIAAGAAGAIPIPVADAIPIGVAQIAMIVALGKVFDFTIGQAAAKSIAGVGLATTAGRFVATNVLKAIPIVGQTIGAVVGASTAVAITETLGWVVADDFFRISVGQNPENITDAADSINSHFSQFRK